MEQVEGIYTCAIPQEDQMGALCSVSVSSHTVSFQEGGKESAGKDEPLMSAEKNRN